MMEKRSRTRSKTHLVAAVDVAGPVLEGGRAHHDVSAVRNSEFPHEEPLKTRLVGMVLQSPFDAGEEGGVLCLGMVPPRITRSSHGDLYIMRLHHASRGGRSRWASGSRNTPALYDLFLGTLLKPLPQPHRPPVSEKGEVSPCVCRWGRPQGWRGVLRRRVRKVVLMRLEMSISPPPALTPLPPLGAPLTPGMTFPPPCFSSPALTSS